MSARTPSLRIVVADEDVVTRQELRSVLGQAGYAVVADVCDGASAIKAVHDMVPDVALLAAELPRMDGIEACRLLRAENLVPGVLLSAATCPERVKQAVEAGVSSYLAKPIQAASLLATIELTVYGWQVQQRRESEVARLQDALATREAIGCAKSVLMETRGMTEQEAYRLLQIRSMESRRPLRVVAEAIMVSHSILKQTI